MRTGLLFVGPHEEGAGVGGFALGHRHNAVEGGRLAPAIGQVRIDVRVDFLVLSAGCHLILRTHNSCLSRPLANTSSHAVQREPVTALGVDHADDDRQILVDGGALVHLDLFQMPAGRAVRPGLSLWAY